MAVVWALVIIVALAVLVPIIAVPLSTRRESAPLPREPLSLRLRGRFRSRRRDSH
jgi:hypothetical protein